MRIAMIGAGYVGLVTGACLADFGHTVMCVDTDPKRIAMLEARRMPIFEPGLAELVAENVRRERLSFHLDPAGPVSRADAVFIAVGTPPRPDDGHADTRHVRSAARAIARSMAGFTVVVTKSTVPVGEGDEIERIIRDERPDADFAVVSNPEFLREGAAISDFKIPDRIVVGCEDARAEAVMRAIYRPLYLNAAPILVTSRRTAELTKYAANAFLAAKVTFINEMADLCEKVGADVQDVARGMGLDRRIGSKFLHAGPGYGGSCFPKDTVALVHIGEQAGVPLQLVQAVVGVNDARKHRMVEKITAACGGTMRGKTVALLGLAFKPNTDDMRDAPALTIIDDLIDLGVSIRAHDPEAMEQSRAVRPDIAYADDPYGCAEGADAVVIVTEWNAFRALDLGRLRAGMQTPVMVDLRNVYDRAAAVAAGLSYTGVGKG